MLNFYVPTFILVAFNLLILYAILKRLLFKPVTQFMDNRTKMIKNSLESAEKAKAEAEEIKAQYQKQIRNSKEEADSILNDARARANKEYDAILTAAKQDAEAVMAKARVEIEREREQMLKDIKNHVASLALSAASKVLEANMDTDSNRALVDKFIDEAGAA